MYCKRVVFKEIDFGTPALVTRFVLIMWDYENKKWSVAC